MERPSIAIRPRAYRAGLVYSVLPINGAADLDFTRATSATRVENDNEIQEVALNTPRLDYSGNGCPSLLLEPESTNRYLNSEPIVNEGAGNVTYESFAWDNGFTNCVRFGDESILRYRYGGSVVSGNEYTLSAYIIMDDLSKPLVLTDTTSGDFSVIVGGSLTTTISSINHITGNVWRISAKGNAGGSSNANGIVKYTTQSSKGFRVVGWQLEEQSYATSYIPTSGSIETREQDSVSKDGLSDYINSSEGVLYAEIQALSNDLTNRRITLSDGTVDNRVSLIFENYTNRITAFLQDSTGSITINNDVSDITEFNKVAFKYKNGQSALWVNGESILNTSSINISNLDRLNLANIDGSSKFYGNIKDLRVYTTALTDEELTQLTS